MSERHDRKRETSHGNPRSRSASPADNHQPSRRNSSSHQGASRLSREAITHEHVEDDQLLSSREAGDSPRHRQDSSRDGSSSSRSQFRDPSRLGQASGLSADDSGYLGSRESAGSPRGQYSGKFPVFEDRASQRRAAGRMRDRHHGPYQGIPSHATGHDDNAEPSAADAREPLPPPPPLLNRAPGAVEAEVLPGPPPLPPGGFGAAGAPPGSCQFECV